MAVYAIAQPVLNERFGWQLPGLPQAEERVEDLPVDQPATAERKAASQSPVRVPEGQSGSAETLLYGLLSDQGGKRYLSPAGLLYVPGSQEGHRLRHVERHVTDDPTRPGSHGVFDGGMPGALATIDQAYVKAQSGAQTTKREEDGRTIYTVDLGSRIGFVGGSEGKRRRNPMARRVRIVLDKNRVITAYPM
jgi:hypothetical protein